MLYSNKYVFLYNLLIFVNLTLASKQYGNQVRITTELANLKSLPSLYNLLKALSENGAVINDVACKNGDSCNKGDKEGNITNNILRSHHHDSSESSESAEDTTDYNDSHKYDLTRQNKEIERPKRENTNEKRKMVEHLRKFLTNIELLRSVRDEFKSNKDVGLNARKNVQRRFGSRNKVRNVKTYDVSDIGSKESRKRVPKRFQVVDEGKRDISNDDSSNEKYTESEETTFRPKFKKKKPKKIVKEKLKEKKEAYIQGSGRIIKVGQNSESDSNEDFKRIQHNPKDNHKTKYLNNRQKNRISFRRRLPQFLPKRYHWKEEDLQHLGFYWFDGPQGRYPNVYRIGY